MFLSPRRADTSRPMTPPVTRDTFYLRVIAGRDIDRTGGRCLMRDYIHFTEAKINSSLKHGPART